jgi:hypothetical protein
VREGGRGERRRGEAEEAAVVLTSLKGQWCKSFWPEFFASNSSFRSHEAQRKTALNILNFKILTKALKLRIQKI